MRASKNIRKKTFQYKHLNFIGKISLKWSNRLAIRNLIEGNWLDLLSGYHALLLRENPKKVNISSKAALDFKLSNSLKSPGIKTVARFLTRRLPFKSETFDNITIINGLEHLDHPQEILNEIFRVLRKNGRLQIIVPNWRSKPILEFLAFKLKNRQAKAEIEDHKMYYDKKDLWPMLVKAGFKPSRIHLKTTKLLFSTYALCEK